MDAPGWSNIDQGNIINTQTEGRSTQRSAGSAMHTEDADQEKAKRGMNLMNIFQVLMEEAFTGILAKRNNFKDEEEDNQISISANSDDRKTTPTKEVTQIKADQSEELSQP